MKYQPPFDPAMAGNPVDGIFNDDPDAPYVNGNPATAAPGSIPPAQAFEHPQREIVNILTWAGITPSHENLAQLKEALRWLVGTRLAQSIGGGVPLYDGLDVAEFHRFRSLIAGTNIRFDLVENPPGSAKHAIRVSYDASGTGVGSGNVSGLSGTCNPVSKLTLTYTGADQIITVPAGATYMWLKLWGAGTASGGDAGTDAAAGGYTEAWFNVTPGTQYSVVVGQGGAVTPAAPGDGIAGVPTYGFGGAADFNGNTTCQGGGLTGLFTGTGAVLATDMARALAIAGGAATGDAYLSSTVAGERGNGSGGMTTMAGRAANPGGLGSGGGGGYAGGDWSKGGTGFIHASKVQGAITAAGGSSDTPGNNADVDYVSPLGAAATVAGARGQHGLAIVRFFSGTCP